MQDRASSPPLQGRHAPFPGQSRHWTSLMSAQPAPEAGEARGRTGAEDADGLERAFRARRPAFGQAPPAPEPELGHEPTTGGPGRGRWRGRRLMVAGLAAVIVLPAVALGVVLRDADLQMKPQAGVAPSEPAAENEAAGGVAGPAVEPAQTGRAPVAEDSSHDASRALAERAESALAELTDEPDRASGTSAGDGSEN